ncbi:uncharacterized protein N7515_001773 [Penicillium bovifimosum]|uniref:Histone deacetylase domain-containing protein n=1 Tax=Penicillium bovifimosum TaxID=126998 RepID=A0A9W9HC47_9EURO|nr:uncharacterized protein N7515_001773 [Penicillium bovifimosum]KAJ5142986.1 hypothetical protein N7515_001773 [Penicillium bovifimosum]
MDPHKLPSGQEDPPFGDSEGNNNIDESHDEMMDALNRLTLATITPLPASPRLSPVPSSLPPFNTVQDPRSGPFIPSQSSQASRSVSSHSSYPLPATPPSSTGSTARDERRKSNAPLQKRKSAASLRSVSQPHKNQSPIPHTPNHTTFTSAVSPPTANSPVMPTARLASGSAPEAIVPTASSVAAVHFAKELVSHQSGGLDTKTAVILHDDCYGHRYSRLEAPKRELDGIVERPERIRACAVGISAAYVRLGSRYAGALPSVSSLSLERFPFQIVKTDRKVRLSETAVTDVHGTQWMSELKWMGECAEERLLGDGNEVARQQIRADNGLTVAGPPLSQGDLYLCSESIKAFEGALGGVCEGIDRVFNPGPVQRAFVCIRPPGHHCSADFPSGFCWINNVHVGISHAASTHGLTHAAILDFDLHHGDGSQDITYDHNSKLLNKARREFLARTNAKELADYVDAPPYTKAAIGYYSLHDVNSFPCENGERDKVMGASLCLEAQNQSIWNVHLEGWDTMDEFWVLYRTKYNALLTKARSFLRQRTLALSEERRQNPSCPPPKAAIFISAGFDASEWEGSGMQRHSVKVPTEFYAKFTADVISLAQEEGLGVEGRVISILEGGYSDRALCSGVLSHLSGLSGESEYSEDWWSQTSLQEMDAIMAPPSSKGRKKAASTYLTATQSFTAKVVTPGRERTPGVLDPGLNVTPLPEVSWAVATEELAKLIIPSGRQTLSCRPAELNRQRREQDARVAGLEVGIPAEASRQLRIRKPKESTPAPATPRPATPRRQSRKTPKTVQPRTTTSTPRSTQEPSPSIGASRRKSASVSRAGSRAGTPRRGNSPVDEVPPVPRLILRVSAPDAARGSKMLDSTADHHWRGRAGRSSRSPKRDKRRNSGSATSSVIGSPVVKVKDEQMED